jgi:hydrazine synthase alpha subunit-like protein
MGFGMRKSIAILFVVLLSALFFTPYPAGAHFGNADKAGENSGTLLPEELGFDEILFVKRKPYSSDHYYTDINNGTSPDRFLAENGIHIYNLRTKQERPVVTTAQMPGGKGFIGKISLSFDAQKVIFDFRQNPGAGFRIWEVNVDGSGLRQVLMPPKDEAQKVARWGRKWHTDDIHPCYLPDGKIIFSSTRSEHTVLCGGSAHLVAPTLHRMDANGENIEQLTKSPVSEFCPVVLDDGRVMYHRWEYIDKGARVSKTIWSMNPGGTRPQELYGVSDDTTTVYMYPQAIPGTMDRLVCVGTCHYPQGGCLGAILLIDLQKPILMRGPDPDEAEYVQWDHDYAVTNITPQVFIERRTEPGWFFRTKQGKYVHDRNGSSGHLYTHPYPVREDTFLVSYKVDPADHYKNVADAYALYLLDTRGNHRLVHKDDTLSCWHPTPLVARKVPPLIHSARHPEYVAKNEALCILANVYQGMEGIKPGEVKWLRINEAVPRYWDTGRRWGSATSSSSWKAALWPRVQWGVVPVEKDGSAYFTVPANRSIFFQALDKNFQELQRERTYVNYHAGEVRSCVGCHGRENRAGQPSSMQTTIALRRPPSTPQPQPCDLVENGGNGQAGQTVHYPTDIQPIFDAKCVSCHGNREPDGGLKLTGDITVYYNTSYEELCKKQLAGPIIPEFTSFRQGDQGNYNGAFVPPKSLGSYKSVLIELLTDSQHPKNAQEDHSQMLTETELMVLSRWIDTNYQFYGTYYGRHHSAWTKPDPKKPSYTPTDFRRKATFEEAISMYAPDWHR